MAIFDIESFRDYFLQLFLDNLDAKITQINTEKSDDITLESFELAQYVNDMNDKVMNYDSFILYGLLDITSILNAGAPAGLDVTMSFEIAFTNLNDSLLAETRIMRYTRALSEVVEENSSNNSQIGSIEVSQYAPITLALNKNSPVMKVGGISIKGTIT